MHSNDHLNAFIFILYSSKIGQHSIQKKTLPDEAVFCAPRGELLIELFFSVRVYSVIMLSARF